MLPYHSAKKFSKTKFFEKILCEIAVSTKKNALMIKQIQLCGLNP